MILFAVLFFVSHVAGFMAHLIWFPEASPFQKLKMFFLWEVYTVWDFCSAIVADVLRGRF